jgi:hypothetical protein
MTSLLAALSDLLIQLILVSCTVSILGFALFGAYTLLSAYHTKLLELERNKCESKFAKTSAEKGARITALTVEVEGLRQRVLETTKEKEEVEAGRLKREVGFLETEARWRRERDELERALNELAISSRHAADIIELKASIQGMEALCASKDFQIRALVEAREDMETTTERYQDKITELTDKLSEYRRLATAGEANGNYGVFSRQVRVVQRRTRNPYQTGFKRYAVSACAAVQG